MQLSIKWCWPAETIVILLNLTNIRSSGANDVGPSVGQATAAVDNGPP
jgi:hypothetical protein